VKAALVEKAQQTVIRAKKDVQAALDPITIGIPPGRHFAAGNSALL